MSALAAKAIRETCVSHRVDLLGSGTPGQIAKELGKEEPKGCVKDVRISHRAARKRGASKNKEVPLGNFLWPCVKQGNKVTLKLCNSYHKSSRSHS